MNAEARVRVARIHAAASFLAILLLVSFWTGTVVSELFFDWLAVGRVKTAIVGAIPVLIVALATAGATGRRLVPVPRRGLPKQKLQRLRVIAANGMVCLVPCALVLWRLSGREGPSSWFYGIQALELTAGAVNLTLIGLNVRDGRRLKRPRRAPDEATPSPSSTWAAVTASRANPGAQGAPVGAPRE